MMKRRRRGEVKKKRNNSFLFISLDYQFQDLLISLFYEYNFLQEEVKEVVEKEVERERRVKILQS